MIPYGKQSIDNEDISEVLKVLQSDWLTTGPKIAEFERVFSDFTGAKYAVAVCNGTAALHCIMYAIGIGKGDEVILPSMTFASTANCIVFQGGTPIFADVDEGTLLIDPDAVSSKISAKTKAVIAVDYAGQPCNYGALKQIADKHGIPLVSDGCHSLGAEYRGKKVGTLSDLTAFSFHPVKHITTGEGGMVTTDNPEFAKRMARFRNHGIDSNFRDREKVGTWYYEMIDLGYNYRITDLQCALGISQLKKLPQWIARRQSIADRYIKAFADNPAIAPLQVSRDVSHAYHLFITKVGSAEEALDRSSVFSALRNKGIGVNVHYIPVHLHPFYRDHFGTASGDCPVAEEAYEQIISLPIFPALSDQEVNSVISALNEVTTSTRNNFSTGLIMKKEIKIKNRLIGEEHPVFIVAECGVTCNYDMKITKELIDVVHESGADAIKFIFWFPEEIMSDRTVSYTYETVQGTQSENMFDMLNKLRFSLEQWKDIKAYADQKDVILFSTVNSPSGIEFAETIGLEAYKLSSWDFNYHPLWKRIASLGKPMLIDTGPVNTSELAKVMQILREAGNDLSVLIHCFHTGEYSKMNMNSIPYMRSAFNTLVGYSAPDLKDEMDIVAISLGAVVLEKRLTLSRSLPGHHHVLSKEPAEFKSYVQLVRNIQSSLGCHDLIPSEADLAARRKYFRHLVAKTDISAETVLAADMLESKRPEGGISPEYIDFFVGRKIKKSLKKDESLSWNDI